MTGRGDAVCLAVVTDLHLGTGSGAEAAAFRARAEAVVAEVNTAGVDAVLVAGDLTQEGSAAELRLAQTVLGGLDAPVIAVPGNHDIGNKSGPGSAGPCPEAVRRYEGVFGPACGVSQVGFARVVRLNAPVLGAGTEAESAQWDCLENALREEAGRTVLVLLHYPPFVLSPAEPDDPYWNLAPEPRGRLLRTTTAAGVRAIVSGHLHRTLEHRVGDTCLYTAAPVAFGLPQGVQPTGWSLLSVPLSGRPSLQFQPAARG